MRYKNSTLKNMTKDNLISIIRCLEHNIDVLEERNNNQYKLLLEKDIEYQAIKEQVLDKLMKNMWEATFVEDTDMQKWDGGCWIRYKLLENVVGEMLKINE